MEEIFAEKSSHVKENLHIINLRSIEEAAKIRGMTASHPPFPNFKPYDRVAVRMPMDRYCANYLGIALGAGDMLYVIRQDWLDTHVEEARTGIHMTIKTLDLEPWSR